MIASKTTALVAIALLLAGCADDAPAAADDGPRVSVAGEPHVAKPEPFASDFQAYGMIVGPDGVINTVTTMGFTGTGSGNLTVFQADVTWEPMSLPLRMCLQDAVTEQLIPEVPCAEGTGEAHISWDNVTAGMPAGLPPTYRRLVYFAETPQVIGILQQHLEGVTVD